MIDLYSGTPGSGKSLHLAKTISEHIREGKPAIGNVQINYDLIKGRKKGEYLYVPTEELTVEKILNYCVATFSGKKVVEDYVLIVIDESQRVFNSRDWGAKSRSKWLDFFCLHRHYGIYIILVAQFDRMLDRQIRSLIENEYVHRKVGNGDKFAKTLNFFAFGKLFLCKKVWYPMHQKLSVDFFVCKKSLYSLYDTFAIFSLGNGALGVGGTQGERS